MWCVRGEVCNVCGVFRVWCVRGVPCVGCGEYGVWWVRLVRGVIGGG